MSYQNLQFKKNYKLEIIYYSIQIGDSIFLKSNNRINKIQVMNDSDFFKNGTKYEKLLNTTVEG